MLLAGAQAPDVRDDHDRTPLHVPAFGRHHDAVRALGKCAANVAIFHQDGLKPESLARMGGYEEMVSILKGAKR